MYTQTLAIRIGCKLRIQCLPIVCFAVTPILGLYSKISPSIGAATIKVIRICISEVANRKQHLVQWIDTHLYAIAFHVIFCYL